LEGTQEDDTNSSNREYKIIHSGSAWWVWFIRLIIIIITPAHYSPLLEIGLSNFSLSRFIFGYSHPAPAIRPSQIVTSPGLRAFALCVIYKEGQRPSRGGINKVMMMTINHEVSRS
jgi:hypothetical protein